MDSGNNPGLCGPVVPCIKFFKVTISESNSHCEDRETELELLHPITLWDRMAGFSCANCKLYYFCFLCTKFSYGKYFSSLNSIVRSIFFKIGLCFKTKGQIQKRIIITASYRIVTENKSVDWWGERRNAPSWVSNPLGHHHF